MSTLEPCRTCGHPRHTHGTGYRIVETVTGPAVNSTESISKEHYEHIGRDVTGCDCTRYVTERNGEEPGE